MKIGAATYAIISPQLLMLIISVFLGQSPTRPHIAYVGSLFIALNSIALILMFSDIIRRGLTPVRTLPSIIVISVIGVMSLPVHFALIYLELGIYESGRPDSPIDFLDAIYFSVVTWTTLGYGDILPHKSARAAVVAEVALSSIVMAMLMAAIFAAISFRKRDPRGPVE
ncbi:ion channel [Bosea sp. 124]|uniref:ion channel n=1 Tax=Bosea sp. 124 TaxID=2135642 RepID=UPI000D39E52C|nr:ion channel [Bosea sp. 124]